MSHNSILQIAKLQELADDYAVRFPGEEKITNFLESFGYPRLIEIVTQSKDRRIIWQDDAERHDEVLFSYDNDAKEV